MLARSQRVLVETLRDLGCLDETQTDNLMKESNVSGSEIEKLLIDRFNIPPDPMLLAKAKAYKISPIKLEKFKVIDQCFEFLEVEFCKRQNILPLGAVGSYLAIATADPLNPLLKAAIESQTKKPFYFLITHAEEIEAKYSSGSKGKGSIQSVGFSDVVEALGMEFDLDSDRIEEKDFDSEESTPVILLANRIIEDAYFAGASDIHVEPFEKVTRVRVRVDGVCRERLTIPNTITNSLISRLKVMANMDIAERRKPQDGRIVFKSFNRKGIDVDLRVATCPLNYGEGCVMRLLDKQKSTLPLEDLGFSEGNLGQYREFISRPYGMILHCGPTGSGKSMTLYSALNEINTPDLCIRTAEDPIEYTLPGICQVQMNRRAGVTFASSLRAFLRQDPDIILVGEIRDSETANMSVRASLTGHVLFSTVHTNDAPSTVARLTELGVEPFLISSSLLCICAQRLMRRLCETCKEPYIPDKDEETLLRRAINWSGEIYRPKPMGCPNCGGNGYRLRIGIQELMGTSEALIHGINKGVETSELKAIAVNDGMVTLHRDSMTKARMGVTSVEECVATVPPDMEDRKLIPMQGQELRASGA